MKLKERKGNESEKQVKPVKKSVALVLTIVTVFAFAAACFSLGFCSGKKVNSAYAVPSGSSYCFMNDTLDLSVDRAGYSLNLYVAGSSYLSLIVSANEDVRIGAPSGAYVTIYEYGSGWVDDKYRYIDFPSSSTALVYSWLEKNSTVVISPTLYSGTYTWVDNPSSSTSEQYFSFSFLSANTDFQQVRIFADGGLVYKDLFGSDVNVYSPTPSIGWSKEAYKKIYINKQVINVSTSFYSRFFSLIESYSAGTAPNPVLYTCTLSENTSGMYSFGYIEGEGVTYNHESDTIKGPADSTFQVQLMPFEGYMVDTFTVTDSDGTAKSIVKNSDTLYTITFDNEDFVLNISASVKPIAYTLTIQFEGVGFTYTATPTGNSEKISDNVFECDTGSGAYVAIGPQGDYIIEEISYNVDSGVATIQESGVNGYRVLRNSGNAVVTFTVTTKTDSVVISSGYYWLRSFGSPPNYSTRYIISNDDFQAIKSIDDGEIVWESLAGFIPYDEYSPWFYFESAPATKVQVFAPGSYRITSVPSGVSNPYSSPVALWYPVVYIPEDIKESRGYSSTLVSFMTGGVYAYKSDIQYYNAFYVELPSTQASIPTSLPSGLSGLTLYAPSQNTVIAPQSVSLTNINNGVIGEWTVYYVVDFAGDPDRGEYTGAWFGIQGGQKRSVYNQFAPFYADGNIYINSTVMPISVYSFLSSAFNISSVPIDVDPPSADYWIGLDTVLSYQIFGIPLSALLAVVISSIFVVVVIRLFAGG